MVQIPHNVIQDVQRRQAPNTSSIEGQHAETALIEWTSPTSHDSLLHGDNENAETVSEAKDGES